MVRGEKETHLTSSWRLFGGGGRQNSCVLHFAHLYMTGAGDRVFERQKIGLGVGGTLVLESPEPVVLQPLSPLGFLLLWHANKKAESHLQVNSARKSGLHLSSLYYASLRHLFFKWVIIYSQKSKSKDLLTVSTKRNTCRTTHERDISAKGKGVGTNSGIIHRSLIKFPWASK